MRLRRDYIKVQQGRERAPENYVFVQRDVAKRTAGQPGADASQQATSWSDTLRQTERSGLNATENALWRLNVREVANKDGRGWTERSEFVNRRQFIRGCSIAHRMEGAIAGEQTAVARDGERSDPYQEMGRDSRV